MEGSYMSTESLAPSQRFVNIIINKYCVTTITLRNNILNIDAKILQMGVCLLVIGIYLCLAY